MKNPKIQKRERKGRLSLTTLDRGIRGRRRKKKRKKKEREEGRERESQRRGWRERTEKKIRGERVKETWLEREREREEERKKGTTERRGRRRKKKRKKERKRRRERERVRDVESERREEDDELMKKMTMARFCSEVHVGDVGHEIRTCTGPKSGLRSATHVWKRGGIEDVVYFPECFHLHDRVKRPRVGHDERSRVKRLPAIVELCIQAGLGLEDYPTRRRTKPVYWIEGRIEDFETETEEMEIPRGDKRADESSWIDQSHNMEEKSLSEVSVTTMNSWFEIRSGVKKLMEKYTVQTCGYCPEVQVGPKGHKVRMCRASKHQSRNGLHAWQEATIDDIVGPNYVWHVRDPNGSALANDLKRFYGKAPAVVELCVQAGASVPDEYRSMMRLDVISPDLDEVDLVA